MPSLYKDLRRYTLEKLFFPKVAVIDRPGIIINKTSSRFGNSRTQTRVIFHFEDIPVKLYLETVKKIGKEKSDLLWYKIGKDGMIRYILFLKKKNIPGYFISFVLRHIFDTFCSAGMTYCKSIKINNKKKSLITFGENCLICRKTKSGALVAGNISALLSFLYKENIEAKALCCNCPNNCKILASPDIKQAYIPNIEDLEPEKNYSLINFPVYKKYPGFLSFKDLFRFKKINIDSNGIFYFKNKVIFPSEVGLNGVIVDNYSKINELDLLKKAIIKTSEEICEEITKDEKTLKNKIKIIEAVISSFGWGLPFFEFGDLSKKADSDIYVGESNSQLFRSSSPKPYKTEGFGENKIKINLVYSPKSKNSLFISHTINGFMNKLFNKSYKMKISEDKIELF